MADPAQPVDLSELDAQLHALFAANETWKILDCVEQRYGFADGGCWDVAAALRDWLGSGDLMMVAGRNRPAEHVVLRVGEHFLDADGISSAPELLERWKKLEHIAGARIAPFEPQTVVRAGIPRELAVQIGVRDALRAKINAEAARTLLEEA